MSEFGRFIKNSVKMFLGTLIGLVFLIFILYTIKTVAGINLFDDLSAEDFIGLFLSVFE